MVQKQTLGLTLGPRMIQSMEILQMPLMALLEKVETELQENPVLELATDMDDPTPAESGDWGKTALLPKSIRQKMPSYLKPKERNCVLIKKMAVRISIV